MNKKILLLLLPLLTLVLCIIVVMEREPYYACWSDPTYCYLFNGLNIASGHFKVGQVDHPGTPLQIFAGAGIWFFHLFSNDTDVVHDVIARPEWYLFRLCITEGVLVALCMFMAGWMMLRFTGNIFYSLLIQLTHIVSFQASFFSQNLMTEFILVTCGILLAPLLIAYTFFDKQSGTKKIIVAAIICGIMLSGKISSFPALLLWIMIIKSWRHLFLFIAITCTSFLAFTIPAWHAADEFFGFMTDITTHTGKYGGGKKGFVIWSEFFEHLLYLFKDNALFTITFCALTITVIGGFVRFVSNKRAGSFTGFRTLTAIWLVTILQLFMVSKHFASHYLIPAHLLIVPAWIILLNGRFRKISQKLVEEKRNITVAVTMIASVLLLCKLAWQFNFFPKLEQPGKQLATRIENKKYDLALFDCNVTAPFPQPALLFGVNYAGERASYYKQILKQTYPPFYWLMNDKTILRNFENDFTPKEVLNDSLTILYYAAYDGFNMEAMQWDNGEIKVDSVLYSTRHRLSGESMHIIKLKKE